MSIFAKLTKKYEDSRKATEEAHKILFSKKHQKVLGLRLQLISIALTKGRKEPTTCSDQYAIPFHIAKKGFIQGQYPNSDVRWDTENGWITCAITAIFRGEIDSTYYFHFPPNKQEFNQYLSKLNAEANQRLQTLQIQQQNEQQIQQQNELQTLKQLIDKYPDFMKNITTHT